MVDDEHRKRYFFVDFMYAIVVSSALPSREHLTAGDITFWASAFLLVIVLEDYYLYNTQIVPFQKGIRLLPLICEIGLLYSWYIAAVAIPEHVNVFLIALSCFFILKYVAGILHWLSVSKSRTSAFTRWESLRNLSFLIPVGAALLVKHCVTPTTTIEREPLLVLAAAWFLTASIWWSWTKAMEKQGT